MIKFHQDGRGIRYLLLRKIRNDLYVTKSVPFDVTPFMVELLGNNPKNETFEETIPAVSQTEGSKMKFHSFIGFGCY
jgi:hypothetical protein